MDEYTEGLVLFADVLAFKKLVADKTCGQVRNSIRQLGLSTKPGGGPDLGVYFFAFSDSVVRVADILSEHNTEYSPGILFNEIYSIAIGQAQVVSMGLLLRGGIAKGKISRGTDMVFGPAFLRAYEIESKEAKYPRIVVDQPILDALPDSGLLKSVPVKTFKPEREIQQIRQLIRRDDDGQWFVDYLSVICNESQSHAQFLRFFAGHKNLIENELRCLLAAPAAPKECPRSEATSVLSKYVWLANYHDNFAAEAERSDIAPYVIDVELRKRLDDSR